MRAFYVLGKREKRNRRSDTQKFEKKNKPEIQKDIKPIIYGTHTLITGPGIFLNKNCVDVWNIFLKQLDF